MKKDSIKCFISYSHKDKRMCNKFIENFQALSRLYNIDSWYDGEISAGGNIDNEILKNLTDADIVFLLISQSYIASYYCFEKELKIAIERHNKNECIVIPVILRSFVMGDYPFSSLKYIPTDGQSIDSFRPQNTGFVDAFNSIKNLLEKFEKESSPKPDINPISKPQRKTLDAKNEKTATNIKYTLLKNGKQTKFDLCQDDLDSFIEYSNQLPQLMREFSNLIDNQVTHFSTVISRKDVPVTVITQGKNDIQSFLLQLSSYIQQRLVGIENTCVHFRVEKRMQYKTFSEVGYPIVGLNTKPISSINSIIGFSKKFDMPVIKEYNKRIHRETHPNEKVQRNYITFTFNDISKLYDVNISMCISIVGKNEDSNMFIPMAVLRFDKVIEHYLIRYINLCSKLNQNYKIQNILNYGGK